MNLSWCSIIQINQSAITLIFPGLYPSWSISTAENPIIFNFSVILFRITSLNEGIITLSTSIFAQPLRSLTLTCFTFVSCLTIVSPNSILINFSAVTLCPPRYSRSQTRIWWSVINRQPYKFCRFSNFWFWKICFYKWTSDTILF